MFFSKKQWVSFVLLGFLFSCGKKDEASPGVNPITNPSEDDLLSPVELAARDAAEEAKVPERFLLAVGYAETRLQPEELDFGLTGAQFPQASSAFAITREELGINEDSTQDKLSTQVKAYAAWLAKELQGRELSESPASSQEKFDWIWEIASLHRAAVEHKYTERSIFTKELVELLNSGFTWFDPESRETRVFPPENPPIASSELSERSLGLMSVDMRQSQVDFAKRIFLSTDPVERPEATPSGIEVVHCPFTLSVCLDMQNNTSLLERAKGLTHYIIPRDSLVSDMALQVRNHHLVLDSSRAIAAHKIRVMLVGSSGRLVGDSRKVANGNWFTHWQLDKLAELTDALCRVMTYRDSDPQFETVEACLTPGEAITFRKADSTVAGWLGIPDFDEKIFYRYIGEQDSITHGVTVLPEEANSYSSGSSITLDHRFSSAVRYIEREHLVRCSDSGEGELRWISAALIEGESMGLTSSTPVLAFLEKDKLRLWSRGPNGDGTHFIRMKFYDEEGELLAWDAKSLRLKTFEEKDNPILKQYCSNE